MCWWAVSGSISIAPSIVTAPPSTSCSRPNANWPRRADRTAPSEVSEQHRRAGSSSHQAHHPAHARPSIFSLRAHSAGRDPNHAHDQEGATGRPRRASCVCCRPILFPGRLSDQHCSLSLRLNEIRVSGNEIRMTGSCDFCAQSKRVSMAKYYGAQYP
jgi:hypothetical protein